MVTSSPPSRCCLQGLFENERTRDRQWRRQYPPGRGADRAIPHQAVALVSFVARNLRQPSRAGIQEPAHNPSKAGCHPDGYADMVTFATAIEPRQKTKVSAGERFSGIDAFRYFGFIAVVILHAVIYGSKRGSLVLGVVDHLCRFAVPFFFIASGYFLHKNDIDTFSQILKIARRLFPIYAFWLIVYFFLSGESITNLQNPVTSAKWILLGGSAIHLWFLPALGVTASAVLVLRRFGENWLLGIAAAIYVSGLALGPYREAFDIPVVPFDTRNGPFFALLFVAMGYVLGKNAITASNKAAFCLLALGVGMQLSEAYTLHRYFDSSFSNYDFLLGTFFFAVSIFLLSLNIIEKPFIRLMATCGRLSLGMYCVHLVFLWWISFFFDAFSLIECLFLASLVIAMSTITSFALFEIPLLRRLVN